MDFTFNEDQIAFQETARDFLLNEVTAEYLRQTWDTPTGRSPVLWQKLVDLGLVGMTIPEEYGGLGMTALDFVLIAQEAGYVALPEPLVNTVLVAVPTLLASGNKTLIELWLPKIADGSAMIAIGIAQNVLIEDAHTADIFIIERDNVVYFVTREQVTLDYKPSIDPSRKLFNVAFDVNNALVLATGTVGKKLVSATVSRGALGVAAQALGLTQRMLDISVQYTSERKQFDKPIGSFQAIKHHMANIAYKLEYAKTPVIRAAYALTHNLESADVNTSHAKIAACEVAQIAAKNSIQVHGAMGYTWEVDLHIFMKKAWAFNQTWGNNEFHLQRVADFALADNAPISARDTFVN